MLTEKNSPQVHAQNHRKSCGSVEPLLCSGYFTDRSGGSRRRKGQVCVCGRVSAHREVEPVEIDCRRPLCGAAGRQWWKKLGEILGGSSSEDVSLDRMLELASLNRIAVLNAVQFPMDPKIKAKFPEAEPVGNLGFAKAAGDTGYKKRKNEFGVQRAVANLRSRLTDPRLTKPWLRPLGNDAEWFAPKATSRKKNYSEPLVPGKIPHPSAWWRRGGLFGRIAQEKLEEIFSSPKKSSRIG